MKKKNTRTIPLVATRIAPTAAVTSALLSPFALSAPGDLDPAFADLGRLGPILDGPAWSLESLEDGTTLLGGGDMQYYCYYYWGNYCYDPVTTNFVGLLTDTGSTESGFTAATVANTQVFDVLRQPDGQVVAVGRKVGVTLPTSQLTVFRLQADGLIDTTFGTDGIFGLAVSEHGDRNIGTSVVLDPDGRIVVAGSRDDQVIVVRLLPDGSPDDSFGTSGVFAGPETHGVVDADPGARTSILRTADGGYRVTASNSAGCQVFALSALGATDDAFGTSGVSTVDVPSAASTACNSMVSQPDGRLLVAGDASGLGFVARLLEDGEPDPGFSADAVSDAMAGATAVAVGDDGSVVVAGTGVSGESIMRLQMNGELDALFGHGGSTLIDLPSERGTSPVVRDMIVRADGSVVAAGGENISRRAFVVRLLGAGGGDSPGVLSVTEPTFIQTAEGTNEVVVNVRRTGGASGTVSAAYHTVGSPLQSATGGQDFSDVSGRLIWADGDRTAQQIRVPILSDNTVEGDEHFDVMLTDVQGGAGLGTIYANVHIAADGARFGQIGFPEVTYLVEESDVLQVIISRDFYSSGIVTVTLTPVPGTATAGNDYIASPVTVSWNDGDSDWKSVEIPIVNDPFAEPIESFTLELRNPTGGAVIGPRSLATVQIQRNDQSSSDSGGGVFGYLSLLLLGVMSFLRSTRMAIRARLAALFR